MIIMKCDHCGAKIEEKRGFRIEDMMHDPAHQYAWGATPIEAQVCDLPCLLGWVQFQGLVFGFTSRVPERGSKA